MARSRGVFRAIIFGAPESDKNYVIRQIVREFNCVFMDSGDLIRMEKTKNTRIGMESSKYLREKKLVPDDTALAAVIERINEMPDGKSWLLNGFPRTLTQARSLQIIQNVSCVLNLEIDQDLIIKRIRERMLHMSSGREYHDGLGGPRVKGRDDITGDPLVKREKDQYDQITMKLAAYNKEIDPLLQYYRQIGKLRSFSGASSEATWQKVRNYISAATG